MTGSALVSTISWMQLVMLNAVVCGVELSVCAAFSYIPPLLLKSGLDEEHMSLVLAIGPLLGLVLVPVIGRKSDLCTSAYGRRRPFIFLLSTMLIMSLIIVPYCEIIVIMLFDNSSFSLWLLIAGAILLDFSSQACLTPCEALLSDTCKHTDKNGSAFTVFSFMVSFGGCIGYFIAAIDWKSTNIGQYFGSQEQCGFTVLIVLFIVTLFTTLTVADEKPLLKHSVSESMGNIENDLSLLQPEGDKLLPLCRSWSCNTRTLRMVIMALPMSIVHYLVSVYRAIRSLPFVLKRLLLAHFLSWTAVMTFNVFFTDYVGQVVYMGSPNVPADHALRLLYDEGVRVGSWGLLFHCCAAAVYAYCIEWLVARFGILKTYFLGMASFTVSMVLLVTSSNVYIVNLFAACTGVAYATLTTLPYLLITMYHEDRHVFFADTAQADGSVAVRGIGSDLSIMDSTFFVSQVLLSIFMGYFVSWTGTVLTYMIGAGLVGSLACLGILRIIPDKRTMLATFQAHHPAARPPSLLVNYT